MLPVIGSVLLSLGAKLGLDFITRMWKARSEKPAGTGTGASVSGTAVPASGFSDLLKDRTAAVPTATDAMRVSGPAPLPAAAVTPRLRPLGVEDTTAALLYGANRNTVNFADAGSTSASFAIAAYLQNMPQAG